MIVRRWILVAVLAAVACSDDVEVGANDLLAGGSGGSTGGAGAAGVAGTSGVDGATECLPVMCQGELYECGDCLDNDADGRIDAADPECLGPCDDTESSFYDGIRGNSTPCRQDCYFDNDSGSGNDDCYWSHRCDTYSIAPDYPPSGDSRCDFDPDAMTTPGVPGTCAELLVTQSQRCLDTCGTLTPNGCDCFGCCELPYASDRYVWLGSTVNGAGSCDLAHADDPSLCHPCTPVRGCLNPCDECEVCVGRPARDTTCPDGGADVPQRCGSGGTPCGREGQALCGSNQYCITGCCVTIPA